MVIRIPLVVVMVCACFLLVAALPSWGVSPPKDSPKPPAAVALPAVRPSGPAATPRAPKKVLEMATGIAISNPGSPGADRILINQTCDIQWTRQGQMGDKVNIDFVQVGTNTKHSIIVQTSNDGSYQWKVGGINPGKYKIRITAGAVIGESNPFDVVNPALDLVSPAQGAVWYTKETQNITWSQGLLPPAAKLRIDFVRPANYFNPEGTIVTIGDNLANSGKFTWVVDYKAVANAAFDASVFSGYSSEIKGTLRVTAVASGQTYMAERKLTLNPDQKHP